MRDEDEPSSPYLNETDWRMIDLCVLQSVDRPVAPDC